MKNFVRLGICLIALVSLALFCAAFWVATKTNLDWNVASVCFIFGAIAMEAAVLLHRHYRRAYASEDNPRDLIKKMFLMTEYLLEQNEDFFCTGYVEKSTGKVKEARKLFLTGKIKNMISVEEFEKKIKKSVGATVQLKESIDRLYEVVSIVENISSWQRSKFKKRILAFEERFARVEEAAQKYIDFKVN